MPDQCCPQSVEFTSPVLPQPRLQPYVATISRRRGLTAWRAAPTVVIIFEEVSGEARPRYKRRDGLVYVDSAFVKRRGRRWCHLLADDIEELHEFAALVGLSKQAFHRGARIPHYDVTALQRLWLLEQGAQPVTVRQGILLTKHLTVTKTRQVRTRAIQEELFAE